MPELPPVTRTFLPFRPGMASLRGWAVGTVWDIGSSWGGKARVGPRGAPGVTRRDEEAAPEQSYDERGGARGSEVDPQVAHVAERECRALAARGIQARAGPR